MNKKVGLALLVVVMVGIFAWRFYSRSEDLPKTDLDVSQALGSITAEETVKLIDNKGGIVVLSWDSGNKIPVVEAQLAAFEQALKKHDGIQILAKEKMKRDPTKMMGTGGAIPTDEFLKVVKAHPETGAFVLFLAFPNLSPEELKILHETQAKIVVVSGLNPGYKKLLMDRNIDLAIVPKVERVDSNRPPRTAQETFDQNFQVVTSAQAAQLPY